MMKTDRDFPPISIRPSIDQILNSIRTPYRHLSSFSTNKKEKNLFRNRVKILLRLIIVISKEILQGYRIGTFSRKQKAIDRRYKNPYAMNN